MSDTRASRETDEPLSDAALDGFQRGEDLCYSRVRFRLRSEGMEFLQCEVLAPWPPEEIDDESMVRSELERGQAVLDDLRQRSAAFAEMTDIPVSIALVDQRNYYIALLTRHGVKWV